MSKYYAIIVAGGSGSRMNSDIPKQFLLLKGKPLVMRTIEAFYNSDLKPQIILVLSSGHHDYWKNICREYDFRIDHTLVNGGKQRFHSVKNALDYVDSNSIVAVHDAARPLVENELITRTFELARQNGAVIPVVTSKDSVRIKNGATTSIVDRERILLVQTPQVFRFDLLKRAYLQDYRPEFTDDASVVESLGERINITEGSYTNMKITFPEDLRLANCLWS